MKAGSFRRILLFAILIPATYLGSLENLFSSEKAPISRKQVYAVLPFSCTDCSPTVGEAVSEMLLTRMHQIRNISVAAIDPSELIRESRATDRHDLSLTAQWARAHAVDKVLTGTIRKFDTHYIVTVSIIDVNSESVEFSDSSRANVARDLIFTLNHFLINIQRHALGRTPISGKAALQLESVVFRPWNSMGLDRGTSFLYGGRLSLIFRDERIRNFTVSPAIGVYRATVTQPYLKSCTVLYPELIFGRIFRLNTLLSVHPGMGFGLFITYTREDYDRIRENGTYQHTRRTEINSATSFRADLLFSVADRVLIAVSPQTVYANNSIRPSLLSGVSLAFRYTF